MDYPASVTRPFTLAEVMFPFPDPNVRGWVVEAAIQLALRSSHGETILSLDPHNTYDAPLVGKHCFFEVAQGWAVTSTAAIDLCHGIISPP